MPPHKKLQAPPLGGIAGICARMSDKFGVPAETAEQAADNISYLTFVDPHTGLPSIAHEYLIGASGFRNGTVVQFRGVGGTGKSAFCMLEYASANRNGTAYCGHVETEGALMTRSRIAQFGLHPGLLAIPKGINSFEKCTEFIDTFRCMIRGGDPKGSISEAGRKSATKFKAEDAEDPDCKYPILIGVDSMSALGKDDNVHTDIADMSKTAQIGWFSVKVREWLKQRVELYKAQNLTLFLTTHETKQIDMGPAKGYGGPKKTSIAGEAIKQYDTVALDFTANDWKGADGSAIGKIIGLKTFKNRLVREGRRVAFYLTDEHGFDMIHTDATFLMSEFGPFKTKGYGYINSECKRDGYGITCPAVLGDGKRTKSEEEFVRALYDKPELLADIRNAYRVCGYGLPHETTYQNEYDENHLYIGPQPDARESSENEGFPEEDASEPEE